MQQKQAKKSILEMARGAIIERADYEMARILENILDTNTEATAKRKLTLTMEFCPDEERRSIAVSVSAKSKLVSANPAYTNLYVCGEDGTGQATVVEMVPEIPGQRSMDGGEQEPPATLNVVNLDN